MRVPVNQPMYKTPWRDYNGKGYCGLLLPLLDLWDFTLPGVAPTSWRLEEGLLQTAIKRTCITDRHMPSSSRYAEKNDPARGVRPKMNDFLTTSETDHSKVLFENENLKVSKSESMVCQRRFGIVFHLPGPFIKATKTLVSMELLGNNSGWTKATGNAFVCQLWQGPKRQTTFRSIVLLRGCMSFLLSFVDWDDLYIYI